METRPYSMAVGKDFQYTRLLNYQLSRLRESGVLDQLLRRHLEPISSTREYICSAVEVTKSI